MLRLLVFIATCLLALSASAQETTSRPAVLVADDLFISNDRELVARGNVEAYQGNTKLEAREIRYDRQSGALTITGPIRLHDGSNAVILADGADLDPDLRAGLLTGARLVLDQQLQLAVSLHCVPQQAVHRAEHQISK